MTKAKRMTKDERAKIRKAMRIAHKQGVDVSMLATCGESYSIALRIKYHYKGG